MFLALLGAHVALRVEPRLLTFADELLIPGRWPLLYAFPAFSFDAAFLWDHLGSPGGAASYAGAFGSQLYGLPGAGPALLTGLCAAVLLAGGGVLTGLGAGRGSAARYVPPLLLLALLNQYAFRLADLLAFTAALSALLVLGTRPSRGAAGLLAVPVLYLLVGAPALLLPVVGGLRAAQSGRWLLAGACAAAAGLVPLLLGMGLLGVEPLLAYTALTVFQPGSRPVDLVLWGALYGFFVAATLVLAWRRRGRAAEGRRFGRAGAVVRAAVVLAAGAAVALSTYAGDVGALLRVNHRARLRDWPGVLEAARGLPKDWYLGHIGRDVNRALYGTGQLLDRMFAFPQAPEALLPDVEQDEPYKTGAEILLELGAVNQAEHLALESLEMRGARPLLLALLTRIYLAKGLPEAARVFLGALARDVVHAPWAARTRRLLAADPTGSTDELVRRGYSDGDVKKVLGENVLRLMERVIGE